MINSKKIRLLYLADTVTFNSTTGDVIHVTNFVKCLAKKGYLVNLVIRSRKKQNFLSNDGVLTTRLPDWGFPFSVLVYSMAIITVFLKSLFERPTFIYQRDYGLNFGVFIGKMFNIPVVIESNGNLLKESRLFSNNTLLRMIVKLSYSSADLMIFPSRGQLCVVDQLNAHPTKFSVIPNGVDPNKFYPLDKMECRRQLGLVENSFYFGFVGNLAKWQGLETAVLAMNNLIKEKGVLPVKLLIVGDGLSKAKLIELVKNLQLTDYVQFLGYVSHDKIPVLINSFDVCIAPFTFWRNNEMGLSPIKLYEYLSCGRPVIASKVLGTEVIQELDAGLLVLPDSADDLKNALIKAIEILPNWESKSNKIHKEIEENFSWQKRANDTMRIILEK